MKNSSLVAGFLFAAVAVPAAAHESVYTAVLSGPAEAPSNTSPAIGTATVTMDMDLVTMRVQETFSGLLGNTTASHIHCCTTAPAGTAGVATTVPTFTGFPSGVTSGAYDHTFDMSLASSYNPAFISNNGNTVSGAFNALVAGLDSGSSYVNIHSTVFQGGEIRGFLTLVPEPESYAMLLAGLGLLGSLARRKNKST
jgi:hypothetical protein